MKKDRGKSAKLSTVRGTLEGRGKRVPAIFYRTEAGNEPVREWLRSLSTSDRHAIGQEIRTVEYGWPLGMPVCRSMGGGLHEVRVGLGGNRIARIMFYVDSRQRLVLLHGFIKKTQATPKSDLDLGRQNKSRHEGGLT